MIYNSQIDELLSSVKVLSSQIAALRFDLPSSATPCGAVVVDRSEVIVDSEHRNPFEQVESPRERLARVTKPPLPDPRLIRRIIWQRQQRDRFVNCDLICDPVWDMLLDLTVATSEFRQISVTSLCIASRVPPTTALRWIGVMTDEGLVRRIEDPLDRRRSFIALTEKAMSAIARYFEALGNGAHLLI